MQDEEQKGLLVLCPYLKSKNCLHDILQLCEIVLSEYSLFLQRLTMKT